MGRFDGVLLMSDFDNTLVYTAAALQAGKSVPELHPKNKEALEWFVAEGGRFGISTGRALAAFLCYVDVLPINVPCVVANGGGLFDFSTAQYLHAVTLPETAVADGQALIEAFPHVGAEAYPISTQVYVVQPNEITRHHEVLTQVHNMEVPTLAQVPQPMGKILFTGSHEDLQAMKTWLTQQSWADAYGFIFSGHHLLEMTSKEASKGAMVTYLAQQLGIDMQHVYCVGDESNDLSMLAIASQAFAPENCIPAVRDTGATIVCHAQEGAIAQVIAHLAKRYP